MAEIINANSLTAFRRVLAMPGLVLTPIRHDTAKSWKDPAKAMLPRKVCRLQTNGFSMLCIDSVPDDKPLWVYFDKSRERFRFRGDEVDYSLSVEKPFDHMITYKLTIAA